MEEKEGAVAPSGNSTIYCDLFAQNSQHMVEKFLSATAPSLTFLMKKFILRLNFVDKYDESTCCG
ncbi:hypothetical protein [Pectinatus frisingensis]|uniref:hypothetical protein n=1 Tax=Pectinatus frisingensis TaxID=865 RepID=UPI003D800DBD